MQEESVEDSNAEDKTKVENVEEFKAHFYTLKQSWQEKHFTLRGRNQSKVLTLDAVPLEWLSRPDDSDEEMEDAEGSENEEEEDVVMQDADGRERMKMKRRNNPFRKSSSMQLQSTLKSA